MKRYGGIGTFKLPCVEKGCLNMKDNWVEIDTNKAGRRDRLNISRSSNGRKDKNQASNKSSHRRVESESGEEGEEEEKKPESKKRSYVEAVKNGSRNDKSEAKSKNLGEKARLKAEYKKIVDGDVPNKKRKMEENVNKPLTAVQEKGVGKDNPKRKRQPPATKLRCGIKGCKYESCWGSVMKTHKMCVHDIGGTWHTCIKGCDFKTKLVGNLRSHKAKMHDV